MTGTFVALLTPPGKAALATLGVVGPRGWDVVRSLFVPRSGKPLPDLPSAGRYWLGRFGSDLPEEVVLAVRRAEPVPLLALHGHGGREAGRYLVELLVAQGAQRCTWEEFIQYEEEDPIRAAAAAALAQAPTARTAAILLDQYHGALRRALERIEAATAAGDHETAQRERAELQRWTCLGRHLTTPFRVVVAGAPNVGKSSLVNAIAGYQRSIVSPIAGTTRDVVTTTLAIDGWPIELTDTAGLRRGGESLEALGIEQAREALRQADLCLWLVETSAEPIWPEVQHEKMQLVLNKVDLPAVWDLRCAGDALRVSATTGSGIAELCQAISRWLVPQAPPAGTAVPFLQE